MAPGPFAVALAAAASVLPAAIAVAEIQRGALRDRNRKPEPERQARRRERRGSRTNELSLPLQSPNLSLILGLPTPDGKYSQVCETEHLRRIDECEAGSLRIAPYCDPQHTIGAHRDGKLVPMKIIKFRPLLCWFKPQIYLLSADIVLPAGFFVHRTARDASVGVSEVLGGRKI